MIKNLNEIKKHTDKYISDFIKNCIIEEKIDTHYISVEIISKNEIKIRKANGNEIDRVDMILNSMWKSIICQALVNKPSPIRNFYSDAIAKFFEPGISI